MPLFAARSKVHTCFLSKRAERDAFFVHSVLQKDIGIYDDIAGNIENVRFKLRPAQAMAQGHVHDLVHHHEIKFAVRKHGKKAGAEGDKLSVGTGGFHVFINREAHVHQKQAEKAVVTENAHTG